MINYGRKESVLSYHVFSVCVLPTCILNESVASVCYALSRVVVLLSPKYMYIDY